MASATFTLVTTQDNEEVSLTLRATASMTAVILFDGRSGSTGGNVALNTTSHIITYTFSKAGTHTITASKVGMGNGKLIIENMPEQVTEVDIGGYSIGMDDATNPPSYSNLEKVTIGENVEKIDHVAFAGAENVTITMLNSVPIPCETDAFESSASIIVPKGSKTAYQTSWPSFASQITANDVEKVDEHIARFDITDTATVKFSRQHPVYGIYGENILASFDENFSATDQGVYDTSATGTTIMENHQQKDTIYLKGTGTVTVWAGSSAVAFPFKALGKGGGSGGGTIYRTSTTLHDGDTTNPITVDGEPVTVKSGDFAISGHKEFIFDGTYWDELGDMSGLGALAYKDNASGTLTGTAVNVSVTGTPSGSISVTPTTDSVASVTNKGTLPSFSYNSTTEELTFNAGTLPTTTNKTVMTGASATFSGTSITSTGTVTAEGSVTVS